jgi:hypothetical protein
MARTEEAMKERLDGFLSRKSQNISQTALVYCLEHEDGTQEWVLRRPGLPDLGLGDNFGLAQMSVTSWVRAQRSTT